MQVNRSSHGDKEEWHEEESQRGDPFFDVIGRGDEASRAPAAKAPRIMAEPTLSLAMPVRTP